MTMQLPTSTSHYRVRHMYRHMYRLIVLDLQKPCSTGGQRAGINHRVTTTMDLHFNILLCNLFLHGMLSTTHQAGRLRRQSPIVASTKTLLQHLASHCTK